MPPNATMGEVGHPVDFNPETPKRRVVRANVEENPGEFIPEIPQPLVFSACELPNELIKKNRSKWMNFTQRQNY